MYNSRLYTIIRLCAGVLTLVALLGQYFLPKKTFTIAPNPAIYAGLSSDETAGGQSRAIWIDQANLKSLCRLRFSNLGYSNCAMSLAAGLPDGQGIDISDYDGFRLKLNYEGSAQRVRVYMRNFNPAYSKLGDTNSAKFISVLLRTRDLKGELFIKLTEFAVADWWTTEFNLPRELAPPRFDNIVTFGIDFLEEGDHTLQIEKFEFVGDWVKTEKLFLGIIILWMVIIFGEGISRLYVLSKKQRKSTEILNELVGNYTKLEIQKQEFETLSKRDALTGFLNRYGLEDKIEALFNNKIDRLTSTVLILDIDHFKRVNDKKGHDAGDAVLQQLSEVFLRNTRQGDIVGRWGGEEFVLVCMNTNIFIGLKVGEKLREMVASHRFRTASGELMITASIGVAAVSSEDTFETVFKRADQALYMAKNAGRNCVMSELDLKSEDGSHLLLPGTASASRE